MTNLEAEAADPGTSPLRLQELANGYPRLRPLIAMNPTAYPALVQWLGDLNDPAVNVALAQRNAAAGTPSGAPKRVSVMGRDEVTSLTPPTGGMNRSPQSATTPAYVVPFTDGTDASAYSPNSGMAFGAGGPTAAGVAGEAAGAPALPAPSGGGSRGGRNAAVIVLVLIAAAVLVLVFLFVSGLLPSTGGNDQTAEESETTQSQVDSTASEEPATEGDSETEEEEEPDAAILFPAPDTALPLNHFVSPSGNIACSIDTDQVTCTINAHEFADASTATCGSGPLSLTANSDQAGLDCSASQVSVTGAATLSYSDYATTGDFACSSSEYGVSCWNTVTGVGFGLSRGGYQITTSGPVDASSFPWN